MSPKEITSLVKYCSTDTCLAILNSQTLRWSAPHLFNDPFELCKKASADFDADQLLKGIINEAISMLFGPTEPRGKHNRLVAAISRWRSEERFTSESEAKQVLKQLLEPIAKQRWKGIKNHLEEWLQFASSLRICCFTDKPTRMHAWQRYADNHAGFALRFSAGEDSALPDPKKVKYGKVPPTVTSLQQHIAAVYDRDSAAENDDFLSKALTRPKHNNDEREWRCFDNEHNPAANHDDQPGFIDKPFPNAELKAVYVGMGASDADKKAVIRTLRKNYPQTRVYQMMPVASRYEVDTKQIRIR